MGSAPRRPDTDGDEDGEDGTVRRCLVTGARLPKASLLRCVVGPDKALYPDVAGRLPGRGLWLQAERDIVAQAVAKRLFARAARAPVEVDPRLPDQVEELLARRCQDILGLARRAGQAVAGFVKVESALRAGKASVLIAAVDGAADGRRKLSGLAAGRVVVDRLTAAELGAAFGREQVVHAALAAGRLAELFVAEAARLGGFRRQVSSGVMERAP